MSKCDCKACAGLLAECGADLWDMYSRKLLIKGWAGVKSPAEKAYCRAHRTAAQSANAAASGARMKSIRLAQNEQ